MPRWKFIHYTHFDEQKCSVASMASFALKGLFDGFFNFPSSPPLHQGNGTPEVGTHSLNTDKPGQSEDSVTLSSNTGRKHVLFTLEENDNGVTEQNTCCGMQRGFASSSLSTYPTEDNAVERSERTFCHTNDVTIRTDKLDIRAYKHVDTSVNPPGNTYTVDIPKNSSDKTTGELDSSVCDIDIGALIDSISKIGETLQDQINHTNTPTSSLGCSNQTSKQWNTNEQTQHEIGQLPNDSGDSVRLPSNDDLTSTNESKTKDPDGPCEPNGSTIGTDKDNTGCGVDHRDIGVDLPTLIYHF